MSFYATVNIHAEKIIFYSFFPLPSTSSDL